MSDIEKAKEALNEAIYTICRLCKRLNPHHTGSPETCDCTDIEYLKKTLAALEEKPAEDALAVVEMWALEHSGKYESAHTANVDLSKRIEAYATSYHARECAKCRELGGSV